MSGEYVSGTLAFDRLEWAGMVVEKQGFLEVEKADFRICGKEDGVLGIGPSEPGSALGVPSVLETMGQTMDGLLGFWLNKDFDDGDGGPAGAISIGSTDGDRYRGDIQWIDVGGGIYWSSVLDDVKVERGDSESVGDDGDVAIFDSGTSDVVAPKASFRSILAALDATCYDRAYAGTPCAGLDLDDESPSFALARCDANLGLRFDFQGGLSVELPAAMLLGPQACDGDTFLDCRGLCLEVSFLPWASKDDGNCDDGAEGLAPASGRSRHARGLARSGARRRTRPDDASKSFGRSRRSSF